MFAFFYQIDDDKKMEELIIAKNDDKYSIIEYSGDKEQQRNFSLYNGDKMLQKILVKIVLIDQYLLIYFVIILN